jgi:hypothetical protein
MILFPSQEVNSALLVASPTIKRPVIKIILELLNLEKVSFTLRNPYMLSDIILVNATISGFIFPETN